MKEFIEKLIGRLEEEYLQVEKDMGCLILITKQVGVMEE